MKKMRSKSIFIAGLALVLSLASCNKLESDLEKQMKIDDEKIQAHLLQNDVQAQQHNLGFYYNVLEANSSGEQLSKNDVVEFLYSISLLDGTLIESNFTEGKPALFKLNSYTMIPEGLDYGIKMMKTGEKYRFYMPSYLAFGNYVSEHFAPRSNFVIDIEVLDKMSETEVFNSQKDSIIAYMDANYPGYLMSESGLCFVDSIPGTGSQPNQGDIVTIDFKRKYLDNSLIKSTEGASFMLNSVNAVAGLQEGLMQMSEGGSAILVMPSSIGFKQSVCVIPRKVREELVQDRIINEEVLPYSILKYVVKLKAVN
jgi:FKBP-type peptidyl-prolyl cis-trans isomerase